MTWTKLDERFWCSRKVADVGLAAIGLYVRTVVWANQNDSGGEIPMSVVKMIGAGQATRELARRLVDAGLWLETDRGYAIAELAPHQAHEGDAEGAP